MKRTHREVGHVGSREETRVGVRELRVNLTDVLRQVREGASFMVTSRGELLAEVSPPTVERRSTRRAGALLGQIQIADDFDTLPSDIMAAIEGGGGHSLLVSSRLNDRLETLCLR